MFSSLAVSQPPNPLLPLTLTISVPPTPDLLTRTPAPNTVSVPLCLLPTDPLATKLREVLSSQYGFVTAYYPQVNWEMENDKCGIRIVFKNFQCSVRDVAPGMTEVEWGRGKFWVEWLTEQQVIQIQQQQQQQQNPFSFGGNTGGLFSTPATPSSIFSTTTPSTTSTGLFSNTLTNTNPFQSAFAPGGSTYNSPFSTKSSTKFGGWNKPVIYLFPPKGKSSLTQTSEDATKFANVKVSIHLCPDWSFSAIYPLVSITPSSRSSDRTSITWSVDASRGNSLLEHNTGLRVSSLFWEASPAPNSTALSSLNFTPTNSVCLPFLPLLSYLDKILTDLSLTVEARTDFITFWLPSFIRLKEEGKEVVIRFMEKEWCEEKAELRIEPEEEARVRVYMVFKGIGEEEKREGGWGDDGEAIDWRKVVGVTEDAWDENKFTVLEWGAAEIDSEESKECLEESK